MKKIRVKEFGQYIYMFKELLACFENACEDWYYGESRQFFIDTHKEYLSEEDAKKVWHAAWVFMGDERQPDLEELKDVKLLCK